jgi:hypothetical protein
MSSRPTSRRTTSPDRPRGLTGTPLSSRSRSSHRTTGGFSAYVPSTSWQTVCITPAQIREFRTKTKAISKLKASIEKSRDRISRRQKEIDEFNRTESSIQSLNRRYPADVRFLLERSLSRYRRVIGQQDDDGRTLFEFTRDFFGAFEGRIAGVADEIHQKHCYISRLQNQLEASKLIASEIQKLELRVCFQKVHFQALLEPVPILRRVAKWRAHKTDWNKTKSALRRKLKKLRGSYNLIPPRRQVSTAAATPVADFVLNIYMKVKRHSIAFQERLGKIVSPARSPTKHLPAKGKLVRKTQRKCVRALQFPRKIRIEYPLARFVPQVRTISEIEKKVETVKLAEMWGRVSHICMCQSVREWR